MRNILTETQRAQFKILLRKTNKISERNRLCTLLAYDEGHDVEDIANILKLSESSIYDYINEFTKSGKTSNCEHIGKICKLSPSQEAELKQHLTSLTYLKAKDICQYIYKQYQIKYSVIAVIKWLTRNDFAFKKPKHVPAKLDSQKQLEFINFYKKLKSLLSPQEKIFFMDAVHPEHQSQPIFGWIPKGEIKTLPATNKQFRLHINGAIELSTMKVITQEYETINASSVISFIQQLEKSYPNKQIHIICDNGRSNKNKLLNTYLSTKPHIKTHYLPPYSPNLNPIERLWKIMRERTSYNKYYETFADFKNAISDFFNSTIFKIPEVLASRINDNFQIICHNLVQTPSI